MVCDSVQGSRFQVQLLFGAFQHLAVDFIEADKKVGTLLSDFEH